MKEMLDYWLDSFAFEAGETVQLLQGDRACGLYQSKHHHLFQNNYYPDVMYHVWDGREHIVCRHYPTAYKLWEQRRNERKESP